MEYNAQHLLLLLTFISIISVLSLGFVIRAFGRETCWQDAMVYWKVYFILALITTSLKFLVIALDLPDQLIIQLLFYLLVHGVLLLALEESSRRKATAYIFGILFTVLAVSHYIWVYQEKQLMLIYIIFSLVYFSVMIYISIIRGIKEKNEGYYLLTSAFTAVIISSILICMYSRDDMPLTMTFVLVGNSIGLSLVIIGFLALTLINEHKKLELLAIKDSLTGMNNRRGLQMMLDIIVPASIRNNKCLSVITVDIDFFKKVNDTYGHDGGDIVLKEFAIHIMDAHRKSDISARLGGEEFVLVLPDTDKDGAYNIAEKIRSSLEALDIKIEENHLKVTASFGVATRCSEVDIDAMLKDADKALYIAKYNGRNQVRHIDDKADIPSG